MENTSVVENRLLRQRNGTTAIPFGPGNWRTDQYIAECPCSASILICRTLTHMRLGDSLLQRVPCRLAGLLSYARQSDIALLYWVKELHMFHGPEHAELANQGEKASSVCVWIQSAVTTVSSGELVSEHRALSTLISYSKDILGPSTAIAVKMARYCNIFPSTLRDLRIFL
jgi:hypothetical protein